MGGNTISFKSEVQPQNINQFPPLINKYPIIGAILRLDAEKNRLVSGPRVPKPLLGQGRHYVGEITGEEEEQEQEESPAFLVSSSIHSHDSIGTNTSLNSCPENMTGPGDSAMRVSTDRPRRLTGRSRGRPHSEEVGIRAWILGCFVCSWGRPVMGAENSTAAENPALQTAAAEEHRTSFQTVFNQLIHILGFEAHPASMMAPTTDDGDTDTMTAQPQCGGCTMEGHQSAPALAAIPEDVREEGGAKSLKPLCPSCTGSVSAAPDLLPFHDAVPLEASASREVEDVDLQGPTGEWLLRSACGSLSPEFNPLYDALDALMS